MNGGILGVEVANPDQVAHCVPQGIHRHCAQPEAGDVTWEARMTAADHTTLLGCRACRVTAVG